MIRRPIRRSVLSGVAISALVLSGAANAQEADPASTEDDTVISTVAEVPTEAESRQDKIVVTGSLLARDNFASASPIQVITAEVATLEGLVDTAALLQGSSLASGSTQLNNTFQNFVTNGGIGAQTIDLRGCGDTRTLVLVDGKRPGPAGTRGSIAALDLNVLPQSIISRIEVLKDGASTIYGSDAVCGVVNIITRDTVDSLELNAQMTRPFDSGGEQYSVSGAYGFQLGDYADFTISAEYRMSEQLDTSERDYLDCPRDYVRDVNGGGLIDRLNLSADGRRPTDNCNNLYYNTAIDSFTGQRLVPSPDGITGATATGVSIPGYRPRVGTGYLPTGEAYFEDYLNGDFLNNRDFIPRNENISLFATADVDLGGMAWDTELLYSRRETNVEGWRQFFPVVGSATNAAGNSPNYGYISDPTYSNSVDGLVQIVAPFPTTDDIELDYYYASTSLSGGFSPGVMDSWSWKVDGSYSRGEGSYGGSEILLSKSGDWNYDGVADIDGDGNPDTIAPPSIDFLSPGILSGANVSDLVAAIGGYQTGNTIYEQTTFTGVLAGELMELPAGALGVGFGAEYREFSIDDQPGVLTQGGDIWGSSTAGPTKGTNSVSEVFAEINVPLLKGAPLAEDVEFSGSVRAFDYDIGGSGSIYKVGLNWQINPVLRARSSYGTSYRAPALFELFLEDQTGFQSQTSIDPCVNWADSTSPNVRANCSAAGVPDNYTGTGSSALVITSGGGELLEPETGDTFTAGIIWTPTFADLNIAVDYYEIEIEDQITSLSAAQIVGGCYATTVYPNDFCDLFERNPGTATIGAYNLDNIQAPTLNVDSQSQNGIDLEVRYTNEFNFGTLIVDGSVNWAFERYINVFGSDFVSGIADNDFNGTIGYPSVVGDASIRLDRGDWTYTWFTDFIGRQDDNRYYSADYNDPQAYFALTGLYKVYTEAQWTHGLSVRWSGDTWTLTGGVRNIFDEHPPQVSDIVQLSAGNTPLSATGYDVRGRRAFVNVSKKF
ncbi:TonB-dependent receptor plug domain-containing protein [Hyphomonas johnsonii]|jgi:iron complex outermembrane receptor protein|uniref:TonB-dependent receptor n=1 Tax=Hyphomonas johnsonii MHS-2 TaxID=1280950 RepID=A0A059FTM1_9PROT|nr:TonB-dependent receptor [Hyphomonas johnsonii]KCZ93813.1 TonB-dependent receptor [Hyphomonas johnsonii MHS-2]